MPNFATEPELRRDLSEAPRRFAAGVALCAGLAAFAAGRAGAGAGRRQDSGAGVGPLRLARPRGGLARPAGGRGPRPDPAGPGLSAPWQSRRARPGDAAPRQRQGSGAQALGRQADAGLQRRGAERQARPAVLRAVDLPSGRRARAIADAGRAVLFRPDPQGGVDDLADRSHGAPHLHDRPAFARPCGRHGSASRSVITKAATRW